MQSLFLRFKRQFVAWPAEDFGRYAAGPSGAGLGGAFATFPTVLDAMLPAAAAPPAPPEPGAVEMEFMKLHAEGRFDEMWDMLAEDAQRAWGGIQNFIHEMPRLDQWLEIIEMEVASVAMLESWTDYVHDHTYSNVARLVMRYHVRQRWREWTFDRQVHLVPGHGGWRTLCYPTRPRAAASR